MLQYTEEILDYDDLEYDTNYYIKFNIENYSGIYKIKIMEENIDKPNRQFYHLVNELIDNNDSILHLIKPSLQIKHYLENNYYKFLCQISDEKNYDFYISDCKIYKENETEYVLK